MKLHSHICEVKLISAFPSSFISFSRNSVSDRHHHVTIHPGWCCNDNNKASIKDETKVFVCKLLRDMNKSDAKEKDESGKLSSSYGHRVMSSSFCVYECACFSATSINKYGIAVRDNKSSFYDHQQSFSLSPFYLFLSHSQLNFIFGRQMNAK
jgi:hypothetical protein